MRDSEKYLIVVPTRNREDIVLQSLPSLDPLLPIDDVRIVVSDNSNTVSEKVKSYCATKGIEWVRPQKVSSMTTHWDWIMDSQTYKAITIMTDRTWLMSDVWLEAKSIAQNTGYAVSYGAGTFNPRSLAGQPVGVFSAIRMTGRRFDVPLAAMDDIMRDNHVQVFLPKLLNSITFKSEYEAIKSVFGSGLISVSPDFEYAYRHIYANEGSRITFLDKLGLVTHAKTKSNGGGFDGKVRTDAAKDFLKLTGLTKFDHAPFPEEMTGVNGVAHELNLVLHELGREPYVTGEQVRRVEKEIRGPKRSRLRSLLALAGLSRETTLKLFASPNPGQLRALKLRYQPESPSVLDPYI